MLEGDTTQTEWKSFIKPFIKLAWPQQVRFRTERTSKGFARIAECSGDDFPDAVTLLLDLGLLRPVAHLDMITYRVARSKDDGEKDFAVRFPRETLLLLDALIADDRAQRPYELSSALEVIADADPTLRQSKQWRRLQDLTF